MKLGVQTYTIRSLAQKKLEVALNLLKHKGITKLEYARIYLNKAHAELIVKNDFEVLSVQATYKKLYTQRKQVISFCEQVRCQKVVVSVLPVKAILGGRKVLIKFALKLNQLSKDYALYGIEVAFHHHDFEFKKIGEQTKFDILFEHTDADVKFVLDTYWAYSKHVDMDELIQKVGRRLMGIHLRDYQKLDHGKHKDCEVGYGLINFHKIIHQARLFNPYLVIEQNSKTPFQSVDKSRKWLYENFKQDINT